MKRLLLILCLLTVAVMSACATAPRSATGVYRPSIGTARHIYIAEFPVNKATKQEVVSFIGVPDKSYTSDGIEYLTYTIQDEPTWKLDYTYYIKDGMVVDVKVVSQTPLFSNEIYQNTQMSPKR